MAFFAWPWVLGRIYVEQVWRVKVGRVNAEETLPRRAVVCERPDEFTLLRAGIVAGVEGAMRI